MVPKYDFAEFDKDEAIWKNRFLHLALMLNGDQSANRSAAGKAAHWIEDYTGIDLDRTKLGLPGRRK
jgi:hypothetical protein